MFPCLTIAALSSRDTYFLVKQAEEKEARQAEQKKKSREESKAAKKSEKLKEEQEKAQPKWGSLAPQTRHVKPQSRDSSNASSTQGRGQAHKRKVGVAQTKSQPVGCIYYTKVLALQSFNDYIIGYNTDVTSMGPRHFITVCHQCAEQ